MGNPLASMVDKQEFCSALIHLADHLSFTDAALCRLLLSKVIVCCYHI